MNDTLDISSTKGHKGPSEGSASACLGSKNKGGEFAKYNQEIGGRDGERGVRKLATESHRDGRGTVDCTWWLVC